MRKWFARLFAVIALGGAIAGIYFAIESVRADDAAFVTALLMASGAVTSIALSTSLHLQGWADAAFSLRHARSMWVGWELWPCLAWLAWRRQLRTLAVRIDRRTVDEFHHQVRNTLLGRAPIEELGDVGVIEVGEDLSFGTKSPARFRRGERSVLSTTRGYSIVTPLALIIAAQFSTSLPIKLWR